jgi:hypothetical protein
MKEVIKDIISTVKETMSDHAKFSKEDKDKLREAIHASIIENIDIFDIRVFNQEDKKELINEIGKTILSEKGITDSLIDSINIEVKKCVEKFAQENPNRFKVSHCSQNNYLEV